MYSRSVPKTSREVRCELSDFENERLLPPRYIQTKSIALSENQLTSNYTVFEFAVNCCCWQTKQILALEMTGFHFAEFAFEQNWNSTFRIFCIKKF